MIKTQNGTVPDLIKKYKYIYKYTNIFTYTYIQAHIHTHAHPHAYRAAVVLLLREVALRQR